MNKGFMVLAGAGMALMISNSPALACGCSHPEEATAVEQSTPVAEVATAPQATVTTAAPVNPTAYVVPEPVRKRVSMTMYNPTGYHSRVRVYSSR